ncbi:MAG: ribosome recycling factor [Bacteroidetes bacterium]|nr:ribosome recycling factor [Bacteroidota bacterium]
MESELKNIQNHTEDLMKKAIAHLESTLAHIRAGKANPILLDGIFVDYYGTRTPLNQVGNINTPDAKTILIQPWDKSVLPAIEKAILAANIGLTPIADQNQIRLSMPPLTEERRKELVKQSKNEAENCKITIRNCRRDGNEAIKKLEKSGLSKDLVKTGETQIQKLTDTYIAKVDTHLAVKEKEIMTV